MRERRTGRAGAALVVLRAVSSRPSLWGEALRSAARLAPDRWWRRPPFLPVPDAAYWHFRMQTAFGEERALPSVQDVVDYLGWCQRSRGSRR